MYIIASHTRPDGRVEQQIVAQIPPTVDLLSQLLTELAYQRQIQAEGATLTQGPVSEPQDLSSSQSTSTFTVDAWVEFGLRHKLTLVQPSHRVVLNATVQQPDVALFLQTNK